MTIDELILELQRLSLKYGGSTDVAMWEYGGGLDDLKNVKPEYDGETGTVVIESAGDHSSGARR